jgi:hypothetical protein
VFILPILFIELKAALESISDWACEITRVALEAVVNKLEPGFGKVGMPARLAVTGNAPSEDLDGAVIWLAKMHTSAGLIRRSNLSGSSIGIEKQ